MLGPGRLPGVSWQNRQNQQAGSKKSCMNPSLRAPCKMLRQQMRIEVAKQQEHLKEKQADRPDCGDSPEPGKDDLSNQRFNLKEQQRAQENGQRAQEIC